MSQVPKHLGLILDGNRRWAKAQGLAPLVGHRKGYDTLCDRSLEAFDHGVKYVSAYVFSTENWNRSAEEVKYLMDLLLWVATKDIDRFIAEGVKVVFVGSRKRLSKKIVQAMDAAENKSKAGTRGTAIIALNYGGQTELAEGVARLVADGVPAAEVTPERLAEYLYHPEIPPVDMVIRTSGEHRLSNFMLWRVAYAELYFSPVLWPDFSTADLDEALAEYASRQRRYGR